MAKRTTIESEQQPSGKEIRLPADSTIKVFNSEFCDVQETVDEANVRLKDAADVATKKHLNLWAFKVCQKLYDDLKSAKNEALASEKLAIKLAQFDKMRKYFKLDELAGLQGRMFGEGEIGGSVDKDDEEPPRETQADGLPDDRPRHLRQPGASATNAVRDLAAKSGAKTNDDPIDKVGRGPDTKH
jgi:hypothetical protein